MVKDKTTGRYSIYKEGLKSKGVLDPNHKYGFPQGDALGGMWFRNDLENTVSIFVYKNEKEELGKALLGFVDAAGGAAGAYKQLKTVGAGLQALKSGKKIADAGDALVSAWELAKTSDSVAGITESAKAAFRKAAFEMEHSMIALHGKCLSGLGKTDGLTFSSVVSGFGDFFSPLGLASKAAGGKVNIVIFQCLKRADGFIDPTCQKWRRIKATGVSERSSYWIDDSGLSKMGAVREKDVNKNASKDKADNVRDVKKEKEGLNVPWVNGEAK